MDVKKIKKLTGNLNFGSYLHYGTHSIPHNAAVLASMRSVQRGDQIPNGHRPTPSAISHHQSDGSDICHLDALFPPHSRCQIKPAFSSGHLKLSLCGLPLQQQRGLEVRFGTDLVLVCWYWAKERWIISRTAVKWNSEYQYLQLTNANCHKLVRWKKKKGPDV